MKKLILSLTMLLTANTLLAAAQPDMAYFPVRIYKVISAKAKVKYIPKDERRYLSTYEGQVLVTAEIEGNLCSLDEKTIGTYSIENGKKEYIHLIAGNKIKNISGCPMFSMRTKVTFPISLSDFVDENKVFKKSLGIITSYEAKNGSGKKTEIIFEGREHDMNVLVKEVK